MIWQGCERLGQPVDHRNTGIGRQLMQLCRLIRPQHDAMHIAGQHVGGISDRLAAADLHIPRRADTTSPRRPARASRLRRKPGCGSRVSQNQRQRFARQRFFPCPRLRFSRAASVSNVRSWHRREILRMSRKCFGPAFFGLASFSSAALIWRPPATSRQAYGMRGPVEQGQRLVAFGLPHDQRRDQPQHIIARRNRQQPFRHGGGLNLAVRHRAFQPDDQT